MCACEFFCLFVGFVCFECPVFVLQEPAKKKTHHTDVLFDGALGLLRGAEGDARGEPAVLLVRGLGRGEDHLLHAAVMHACKQAGRQSV